MSDRNILIKNDFQGMMDGIFEFTIPKDPNSVFLSNVKPGIMERSRDNFSMCVFKCTLTNTLNTYHQSIGIIERVKRILFGIFKYITLHRKTIQFPPEAMFLG